MKRIFKVVTISIIFQSSFLLTVNGQLLDKLRKAAKDRLEYHAVDQVEKGVDKGVEKTEKAIWKSIEGGDKENVDNNQSNKRNSEDSEIVDANNAEEEYDPEEMQRKIMSMMGASSEKIETADNYSFTNEVVYEMNTVVNNQPTMMEYTVLLNPNEEYMGTKIGNMTQGGKSNSMAKGIVNIMDFQNNAMIMIMEEQKMANVMSMESLNKAAENNKSEGETNTTVAKTGKTKDILGYKCYEYQILSNDSEGSIWIAPSVEVYNQGFLKSMNNAAFSNNTELLDLKGLTMEMEMTVKSGDKGEKMDMKMTVISFNKKNSKIDMSNYTSMNFGAGFMGQQ